VKKLGWPFVTLVPVTVHDVVVVTHFIANELPPGVLAFHQTVAATGMDPPAPPK